MNNDVSTSVDINMFCANIIIGCDSFDVSNKIEGHCQLQLNIILLMVLTDYVLTIHYSEACITST